MLTKSSFVQQASGSSRSQPIPILPPPPTSLSSGPSRARRQLAARLAAQREAAEKAAAEAKSQENADASISGPSSESAVPAQSATVTNPFLSVDEEKDPDPNAELEFISPFAVPGEGMSSSPRHSFLSEFQPPSAYSSSSSDNDETIEAVQRNYRLPLEVYDDDEELGDMVAPPPAGFSSYSDDDEDEETLIRETIGYSDFFGPGRYTDGTGLSPADAQNSDDDDEGLVEILVPGRRTPSN